MNHSTNVRQKAFSGQLVLKLGWRKKQTGRRDVLTARLKLASRRTALEEPCGTHVVPESLAHSFAKHPMVVPWVKNASRNARNEAIGAMLAQ